MTSFITIEVVGSSDIQSVGSVLAQALFRMSPLGDGSDVPRCGHRFLRIEMLLCRPFVKIEQFLRLDLVRAHFRVFVDVVLHEEVVGGLNFSSINPQMIASLILIVVSYVFLV